MLWIFYDMYHKDCGALLHPTTLLKFHFKHRSVSIKSLPKETIFIKGRDANFSSFGLGRIFRILVRCFLINTKNKPFYHMSWMVSKSYLSSQSMSGNNCSSTNTSNVKRSAPSRFGLMCLCSR